MAKKEVANSKIAKISQAQQYMILSVLGASLVLGVAISLTIRFVKQISFNAKVIATEEKSIVDYSDVIKKTGVCVSPKGSAYTSDELKKCDPDSIEFSQIKGTLRYDVLENLAANEALNSVPHNSSANCTNPITNTQYTYKELNNAYKNAESTEARKAALQNIKTCSALRVIPDALPSFKNEEAMLASINHIFNVSNWQPESLSPSGTGDSTNSESDTPSGLNPLNVNLTIEADAGTTTRVLHNIEKSIREFNIDSANIEWSGGMLNLRAQATAFYVDESSIAESTQTITEGGK